MKRATKRPSSKQRSSKRSSTKRPSSKRPSAKSRRRAEEGLPGTETALPTLAFPLTHLEKVFFPETGETKGDLIRYYAAVAAQILPVVRDRPLALKRYPDGAGGPFFFQQKAPAALPAGVRAEPVPVESDEHSSPRLIGGTLATLLYTVQLGCIGVDPWHARIASLRSPDYTVIDLDPGADVPFARVVEAALWIKGELDAAGLHAAAKTSGSRGIHIHIPLPPRTGDATAVALAEQVAARVARAHPRETTLTRDLKGRRGDAIYLDYLQNARGKTIAAAYGVRAVADARVSMPLRWSELTATLDQHAFTLRTAPERIARLGDIWAEAMRQGNSAAAVRDAL